MEKSLINEYQQRINALQATINRLQYESGQQLLAINAVLWKMKVPVTAVGDIIREYGEHQKAEIERAKQEKQAQGVVV